MIIDNTVDLYITKLPPADIVTFDCDPEADVDLHAQEGCGTSRYNTYYLILTVGMTICGIAGQARINDERDRYEDMDIQLMINGEWNTIGTVAISSMQDTPFEIYFTPTTATGLRFVAYGPFCEIEKMTGRIQFGDIPADSHTTKEDCEAAGCYWYNGTCHLYPPSCYQLNTQADCERYNCYWAQDSCHPMPTKCEEWLEEQGCIAAGCEWWGPDHPHDPNSCHESRMKVALLDIDPNEPADIHSDEPPGSQYVNFNFGKMIKIYRAVGTGMIKKGGTAGETSLTFIMMGEMWQNRVRMNFGYPKDFDEDFNKTDDWRRYGTILKCGTSFVGVTVEILRMLVYYVDA